MSSKNIVIYTSQIKYWKWGRNIWKGFADTFFESEENYIVVSIQDLKFEKKNG